MNEGILGITFAIGYLLQGSRRTPVSFQIVEAESESLRLIGVQ